MQNNSPNSIITPYNNSFNSQTKPSNKKLFLIIGIALTIIAILVIVIIAIINLSTRDTETEEIFTAERIEETPTLQLYAELGENIPIKDIETIAKGINSNAEVSFVGNGFGMITIPGYEDSIIFEYLADTNGSTDYATELPEVDESDIYEVSETDEEEAEGEVRLSDTTSDIRYSFIIGNSGVSIGKVYGGEEYRVTDYTGDGFDFPTKKEAIEAYLSPRLYNNVDY